MRILFVASHLRNGGAEGQLRVLATGLAARGHDVHLAAIFPEGVHWEGLRSEDRVGLLAIHPVRAATRRGVLLQLLRAPGRLRALVAGLRPDVVHSYLEIPNLVASRALGRAGDPPLVWGGRNAGGRESAQVRWARALGARRSPGIPLMICNSEAGRRAHAAMGYRPRRLEVVPNGIDTDRLRPLRETGAELRRVWCDGGDGPLVGVVGRLVPVKDHGTFLAMAARLVADRPAVRFVIVGDGPLAPALKARARDLGLADRVIFAGEMADMPAVYNALDLVVLTSAWGEGFPNVLGEALAVGVPCVSTDVGDAVRILDDAERIAPAGDADTLAAAVAATLDEPGPPRADLRAQVVERFGVETMVAATEELLRSVAAPGKAVG